MYTVDYGTGVGNFSTPNLNTARIEAAKGISYTQQDVKILKDGKPILVSYWRCIKYNPMEELAIATFGSYGYYSEWKEIE